MAASLRPAARQSARHRKGELVLPWVDNFTRANGALGTVRGLDWDAANWTITSNVAHCAPAYGAELITNSGMETGDPPSNWTATKATLDGVADERTGGGGAQSLSIARNGADTAIAYQATIAGVTVGKFYRVSGWLKNIDATTLSIALGQMRTYSSSSANWTQMGRSYRATATGPQCTLTVTATGLADGVSGRYDDVSLKEITASSMMALVNPGLSQLNAQCVPASGSNYGQCGVVLNCNAAKTSYVLAFVDYAPSPPHITLLKVVDGTPTVLLHQAITAVTNGQVRVERRDATTYRLLYNREQVGADQTISDSEIVSNTRYGVFATDALCAPGAFQMDDFSDPDFAIVYTSDLHNSSSLGALATWVVNRMTARAISLFLCGGDCGEAGVEGGTGYTNCDTMVTNLVAGSLPFNFATGNHDDDIGSNHLFTEWETHCGSSVVTGSTYYEAGIAANAYRTFTVDGQAFIVLLLEVAPRQGPIDWANTVLANNSDKLAIIVTHSYLYVDGTHASLGDEDVGSNHPDYHDGEMIWQELVKLHANVILVCNGHHITGDARARALTIGDNANRVNEMLWSTHSVDTGTLRIFSFRLARREIAVETVNHEGTIYAIDAASEFRMVY